MNVKNDKIFSMESLPESERLVSCPYNRAHQVVAHRLSNHLIKCRKTQETKGTKQCRYNVTHVVPSSELKSHETVCPDRVIVENFVTNRNRFANGNVNESTHASETKLSMKSDETPAEWDKY